MKKILLALILTGCNTLPEYNSPFTISYEQEFEIKELSKPGRNEITYGKLGNSLVSKSLITLEPALVITEDYEYGIDDKSFFPSLNYMAGQQLVKFKRKIVDVKDKIIFPYIGTLKNKQTGERVQCFKNIDVDPNLEFFKTANNMSYLDYCIDSQGNIHTAHEYEYREFQDNNSDNKIIQTFTLPLNVPYSLITQPKETNTNFKQEFIYNGRVNNSLKFIYREFNGDLARPSFTQEVQYDFNQSNIIGFKNLSIEILNATNQEIEYKVITPF